MSRPVVERVLHRHRHRHNSEELPYIMQAFIFLVAVLSRCVDGTDQMGREFVLSFIRSRSTSGRLFVFVSNMERLARVRITIPGLNVYKTRRLRARQTWKFELRDEARYSTYFQVKALAVSIKSTRDISVCASDISTETSSSYMAIPAHALGYYYLGVTYGDRTLVHGRAYYPVLLVIALYNATSVDISYVVSNNGVCGRVTTGEVTHHVLNAGDVYGIACTNDFTGTQIRSSAAVAVIAGHESATMDSENGASSDSIQEMLLPVKYYGFEFVLYTQAALPAGFVNRIVTAFDETILTSHAFEATVPRQFHYVDIDMDKYGQMCIRSNKPVFVVSFGKGLTNNSDVFMTLVISTSMLSSFAILDFGLGGYLGMDEDIYSVIILDKKHVKTKKGKMDVKIPKCRFVVLIQKVTVWPIIVTGTPNAARYIYGSYNTTTRSGVGLTLNMQFVEIPAGDTLMSTTPVSPTEQTTFPYMNVSSSMTPSTATQGTSYPQPPSETTSTIGVTTATGTTETPSSLGTSSDTHPSPTLRPSICDCKPCEHRNPPPRTHVGRTRSPESRTRTAEDLLRLDRRVLSMNRRRLGCAYDNRTSAMSFGCAALATLALTVAVLAISDIQTGVRVVLTEKRDCYNP